MGDGLEPLAMRSGEAERVTTGSFIEEARTAGGRRPKGPARSGSRKGHFATSRRSSKRPYTPRARRKRNLTERQRRTPARVVRGRWRAGAEQAPPPAAARDDERPWSESRASRRCRLEAEAGVRRT